MLDRPNLGISDELIDVHCEVPASWPSARELGAARCHIFQTREFIEAWIASFGAAGRATPYFVEVRDRTGGLALLIPLAIETKRGVRVLGFLDQGHADYNGPVCFPTAMGWSEPAVRRLWARIVAALPAFDVVRLEKMPERIGDLPNPLFLLADGANPESCHGNDLTLPWEQIEASQANLKTVKKLGRGLERIAPTRLLIARTAEERRTLIDALVLQKQRRFEDTRVPGFAENRESLTFLHRASEVFARSGHLFVCALLVGEEITAVTWGLALGRRLYALVMGFAAGEWTRYSCGKVLNLRLLEWLHENGYTYLDHGFGDETWKVQNCEVTVPLGRLVAPHTLKGRFYLGRAAVMAHLRASWIWARLRPLKWMLLRALRSSRASPL